MYKKYNLIWRNPFRIQIYIRMKFDLRFFSSALILYTLPVLSKY